MNHAANHRIVLASINDLPILRTTQSRLTIPCVLLAAILAPLGGIIGTIAGPLLVASVLRHGLSSRPLAISLPSFLGHGPLFQSGLHLESSQTGNSPELPGNAGLHRPIPPLGPDGIQPGRPRHRAEGRDLRRCRRPRLVLLQ